MRLIQAIVWRVICVGLLAAGVAAFYLDLSTAYTVLASRLPDNTALRWSLGVALILVALILRGVAFEFRSKDQNPRWRSLWDGCIFVGSFVPALLLGVAVAMTT